MKKAILIHGWEGNPKKGWRPWLKKELEGRGFDELDTFFQTKIDWNKIKSRCKKFVAIHSSDDPYVSLHYADFFKDNLGAKIIVEKNMKHFGDDDGVKKLPSVLWHFS